MASDLDDTIVVRLKRAALEDPSFPLGIVRLSRERNITFLNRAAREMAGPAVGEGDPISALPIDATNQETLATALSERDQEQASTYRLGVFRSDLDHVAYGRISAIPEYGEQGEVIGSIGFIVQEDLREATLKIHEAVQESRTSTEIYRRLFDELKGVVSFDTLMVTGISKDRNHLQQLFQHPSGPPDPVPTKWWPMQPFVKRMVEPFVPGPLDLDELFARPEFIDYALRDPAVEQFKQQGFHHCLRIGVTHSGKLRAIISLLRRSPIPFSAGEARRCTQLPVADAGSTAIALDRARRLKFSLRLIRQVAEGASAIEEVAQLFVDELRQHYGWAHVSLFQVDVDLNELVLVRQAADAPEHLLAEPYRQRATDGLLGLAYQYDKIVNIGDVRTSPLAAPYVPGIAGTRSEMILPLSVPGSRLRWLMNVESPLRHAFSEEDHDDLKLLLKVIGLILDRAATMDLQSKILEAAADGVIITSRAGVVQEANPAAERLFGLPPGEFAQKELAALIAIPQADEGEDGDPTLKALAHLARQGNETPEQVFVKGDFPPLNVRLRLAGGGRRNVRLTSARLPDLGGKVYLATDLTGPERVQRLEALTEVLHQLATETRVPLSLASMYLSDARGAPDRAEDLIDSALRQIRKADLPLERVLRVEAASQSPTLPTALVDLLSSVNQARSDLPLCEAAAVQIFPEQGPIHAFAAPTELNFCIQGLLAHLLRVRAQREKVKVTVGHLDSAPYVGFALTADNPDDTGPPATGGEELKLIEPVLDGLMRRMGGEYKRSGNSLSRFTLSLKEEASHA